MNENIIKKAAEMIYSSEGDYASVNRDDNGAVSVGRIQWHGTRALKLLKKIIRQMGEADALYHVSDALCREILSAQSWSHRTLGEEEGYMLASLLSSECGRAVQDETARTDVEAYLTHAHTLGVTDEAALIFIADIENQGGAAAARRIILAADGADIDALYRAASIDRVFKNYMTRRDRVYTRLVGHPYGEEAYGGELYEVRRGDTLSAIAVEYGVSVAAVARENGIADVNLIRVGQLLRIPAAEKAPVTESETAPETAPETECGTAPETACGTECGKVPEPILHKVVRGDTLWAISRRYGVSIDAILLANRDKYRAIRRDYIVVGWTLSIPEASA